MGLRSCLHPANGDNVVPRTCGMHPVARRWASRPTIIRCRIARTSTPTAAASACSLSSSTGEMAIATRPNTANKPYSLGNWVTRRANRRQLLHGRASNDTEQESGALPAVPPSDAGWRRGITCPSRSKCRTTTGRTFASTIPPALAGKPAGCGPRLYASRRVWSRRRPGHARARRRYHVTGLWPVVVALAIR